MLKRESIIEMQTMQVVVRVIVANNNNMMCLGCISENKGNKESTI